MLGAILVHILCLCYFPFCLEGFQTLFSPQCFEICDSVVLHVWSFFFNWAGKQRGMINLTNGILQFWENFLNCVPFISSPFFLSLFFLEFSIFWALWIYVLVLLYFSYFLYHIFSRKLYQLYLLVFSINFLFHHLILIFEG